MAFKERQQRTFQSGHAKDMLTKSAFLNHHAQGSDITFTEYLLQLFDGLASTSSKGGEEETPEESLDIPLKALIAHCLLLDLKPALLVYSGDPIELVAQLYNALDMMAGLEAKEIQDRYVVCMRREK